MFIKTAWTLIALNHMPYFLHIATIKLELMSYVRGPPSHIKISPKTDIH